MTENARSVLGQVVFAVAAGAIFAVGFLVESPIVQLVLALSAVSLATCVVSRRWSTPYAVVTAVGAKPLSAGRSISDGA
jgi:hypothetical protein